MYPANPARMGSSQVCESTAPVTHFSSETATVVHPVASQARWDHVDFKVGSSSMTRCWLVGEGGGGSGGVVICGGGGGVGAMTRWCWELYLGFVAVAVVAEVVVVEQ